MAVVLAILSCCGLGCAYSLSQMSPFQIQPPAVSREAQGHLSKLQSCSCRYICHWHHWLAQLRLVGHFSCVEAGQWLCWALEFCSYSCLIICIPHCCLETLSRDVPPHPFLPVHAAQREVKRHLSPLLTYMILHSSPRIQPYNMNLSLVYSLLHLCLKTCYLQKYKRWAKFLPDLCTAYYPLVLSL